MRKAIYIYIYINNNYTQELNKLRRKQKTSNLYIAISRCILCSNHKHTRHHIEMDMNNE